jgi:hypothetical protein
VGLWHFPPASSSDHYHHLRGQPPRRKSAPKMSLAGMDPSKHTADDSEFLDGPLARQLMAFRNHVCRAMSHPHLFNVLTDRFMLLGTLFPTLPSSSTKWIEISTLKKFLVQDASCIELVAFAAGISLPSTDHELLHSLSARQLIAFREYICMS